MAGTSTTGEYAAKRLVRIRDGDTCTKCGMTGEVCTEVYGRGLHIHRLVPGSVYTVEGCVLLCRGCHHVAHGWEKPPIYAITYNDKLILDDLVRRQFRTTSHGAMLGILIRKAYDNLARRKKQESK